MDSTNRQQIFTLVRNAIAAFLIFLALIELLLLINWQRVNWEVVIPTVLSLVASFGIWGADRLRSERERRQAILVQARIEQDEAIKKRQDDNFALIQVLQESLDSIVITQSSIEDSLEELKSTDSKTLDKVAELEKDLETHRDRWAHEGAEDAIQSLRQSIYRLEAQLEGLSGIRETERRINIVAESVNNVNAQMERLRHVVRELPGTIEEQEGT